MKTATNLLKSLAVLTLIAPAFLVAQDHEDIGTRKPTQENVQEEPRGDGEEAQCNFLFDRYPQVYVPNNIHTLVAVSALGDTVEIEDGSVWKVSTYDGSRAQGWRSTDPLMITQNNRWFSSYAYRIVNQNTNTSIEANLFLGPIKHGQYSRYISDMDTTRGLIKLTDTTHWEISSGDLAIFRDWAVNDSIIIGYNSGWDSSSEGLLINVTMNNYVRARQF